jgi:hypothetical protein
MATKERLTEVQSTMLSDRTRPGAGEKIVGENRGGATRAAKLTQAILAKRSAASWFLLRPSWRGKKAATSSQRRSYWNVSGRRGTTLQAARRSRIPEARP